MKNLNQKREKAISCCENIFFLNAQFLPVRFPQNIPLEENRHLQHAALVSAENHAGGGDTATGKKPTASIPTCALGSLHNSKQRGLLRAWLFDPRAYQLQKTCKLILAKKGKRLALCSVSAVSYENNVPFQSQSLTEEGKISCLTVQTGLCVGCIRTGCLPLQTQGSDVRKLFRFYF